MFFLLNVKLEEMCHISRIALYATRTSPIMHLICPPSPSPPPQKKIAHALFSISLGTAVIPRRNENQRLCKNFGGQIRCIMRRASGVWDSIGDASVSLIGFYDQRIYEVAQNWKTESKFAPHNSCTVQFDTTPTRPLAQSQKIRHVSHTSAM